MLLPGGIAEDGTLQRDFAFRPMTGAVQLAVAESGASPGSLPARVTAALAASLEMVGGRAPLPEVVTGLAVADRQFLMLELAARLAPGETWLTAWCAACRERFDFAVDYRCLPVKEAGAGYPFVDVKTSRGQCRFRVPIGADQELVHDLDDGEALRCLLACCLVAHGGRRTDGRSSRDVVESFSHDDFAAIDTAFESVAPEVAVSVQAACPACGALHVIPVDLYRALSDSQGENLLQEIHAIASAYHWGEAEILALPLDRRRRYLELIERSRA
jgi:hypothetical protein